MIKLYRPIALLLVLALTLPYVTVLSTASADTSNDDHVPQGQLTRRGVTGTIVAKSDSDFVVETKWGNVTINVGSATIKSKGQEISWDDVAVGDRAGVLLDKAPDKQKDDDDDDVTPPDSGDDTGTDPDVTPPDTPDDTSTDPDVTPPDTSSDTQTDPDVTPPDSGDDTGTDVDTTPPDSGDDTGTDTEEPGPKPVAPSFRQDVTALRITIVPSKSTRKHECVVVTDTGTGTTTVLDEEGNEETVDGDAVGTEGEDVCLLTRGKAGGGKEVRGSASQKSVEDRLAAMAERNEALAERLAERQAEAEARRNERLERTVVNAPEGKKGKAENAKNNRNKDAGGPGKPPSDGSGSGGGNSGRGNSGGGGGNSEKGNSGGGGGNSGNQGGGNSGGGGGNSGGGGGNSGNQGGGNSGGGGGNSGGGGGNSGKGGGPKK